MGSVRYAEDVRRVRRSSFEFAPEQPAADVKRNRPPLGEVLTAEDSNFGILITRLFFDLKLKLFFFYAFCLYAVLVRFESDITDRVICNTRRPGGTLKTDRRLWAGNSPGKFQPRS